MSDPIGIAPRHDAAPRRADTSHQVPGGKALAKGVRYDAPGIDGEADHGKGHSGEQPSLRGCHDEISKTRDKGGADERRDVPDPGRDAVRKQGAGNVAHSSGRQEQSVQALGHSPVDRRDDDEHAHGEPLQAGQCREQGYEKPQRAVLHELSGAVQDRAMRRAGFRALGAEAEQRQARDADRRRVGDKGERLDCSEREGAEDRAPEVLGGGLGAAQDPVRMGERRGARPAPARSPARPSSRRLAPRR